MWRKSPLNGCHKHYVPAGSSILGFRHVVNHSNNNVIANSAVTFAISAAHIYNYNYNQFIVGWKNIFQLCTPPHTHTPYKVALTLMACALPPIAARCMGVNPSFPLKSICAPPDSRGRIIPVLLLRPHAWPKGVSKINHVLQK